MDGKLSIKGKPWEKLKKFDQSILVEQMVNEAAIIAVDFSKESFRTKCWRDKSTQKWKPRKRKDRGSLMIRTGRLKRSVRKIGQGKAYVIIGTDVPYAKAHNEGETISGTVTVKSFYRRQTVAASVNIRTRKASRKRVVVKDIKVRSHKRKMNTKLPQRKFFGASYVLAKQIEYHMLKQADRMLK